MEVWWGSNWWQYWHQKIQRCWRWTSFIMTLRCLWWETGLPFLFQCQSLLHKFQCFQQVMIIGEPPPLCNGIFVVYNPCKWSIPGMVENLMILLGTMLMSSLIRCSLSAEILTFTWYVAILNHQFCSFDFPRCQKDIPYGNPIVTHRNVHFGPPWNLLHCSVLSLINSRSSALPSRCAESSIPL